MRTVLTLNTYFLNFYSVLFDVRQKWASSLPVIPFGGLELFPTKSYIRRARDRYIQISTGHLTRHRDRERITYGFSLELVFTILRGQKHRRKVGLVTRMWRARVVEINRGYTDAADGLATRNWNSVEVRIFEWRLVKRRLRRQLQTIYPRTIHFNVLSRYTVLYRYSPRPVVTRGGTSSDIVARPSP